MKKLNLLVILFSLFLTALNGQAQSVINLNVNDEYSFPLSKPKDQDAIITNAYVSGDGVIMLSYNQEHMKLKFTKAGSIKVNISALGIIPTPFGTFVPFGSSAEQVFNVKQINYNIVPNITWMNGPNEVVVGSSQYWDVTPAYNESFIKYEWKVDGQTLGYNTKPYLQYTFNSEGHSVISCQGKNTVTGVSGTIYHKTIYKTTRLRSMSVEKQSFAVLNLPGALVITETDANESFNRVSNNKTIKFQLNQLMTGANAASGTIQVGNSIDTGNLPKGVYTLTLMDGNQIETHKVLIK